MSEADLKITAKPPDMQAETGENRQANGRFQPGKSGNPKGRPRGVRYLSEAFRFWLAAPNTLNPEATNADEIAAKVGAAALDGDLLAVKILFERTEGKVKDGQWKFREPDERIDREKEIYERMDEEGLDYAEVIAVMEQEERQEEEEKERQIKAAVRRIRREERLREERERAIAERPKAEVVEQKKEPEAAEAVKANIPAPAQQVNWMEKYLAKAAVVMPAAPLTAEEEVALYKSAKLNGE